METIYFSCDDKEEF